MSKEPEGEEIELMRFAWGIHPATREFGIWGEPYEVQVADHEGGQWVLTYYPPTKVSQDENGFTVHATPRKSITRRFDSIAPILRSELGDEAKKRFAGRRKDETPQVIGEIKKAIEKVRTQDKPLTVANVARAMEVEPTSLRRKCRKHFRKKALLFIQELSCQT